MRSHHVALPALLVVPLLVLLVSGCNLIKIEFGDETPVPVSRPATSASPALAPTPTPAPPPTPRPAPTAAPAALVPPAPAPTAAPVARAPTPQPAPSPSSGLSLPAANDPLPSWPVSRPPKPPPPPPGTRQSATGKITVGQTVTVASTEVPPAGGQIEYTRPGDSVNGLKVTVPANAYPDKRAFKVSYAPVIGVTFKDFKAASPLITVDNGGGYSGEMMRLTVPVTLAPGEFAMGFLYDDKTGKLEGLPLLAMSASSVTVGTYHYSNVIISVIDSIPLKKDIDSGFRPGIDDWQFVNRGSYIEPGGHCAGQALTALWYYVTQPDGKDLTLYDRYDNNRLTPATPEIWEDDSYGYRFASVIQKDINWDSFANKLQENLAGVDDELTFKAFAYSMQLTGEPQEVGLFSSKGGGHDMIGYCIKDNQIYIADPNYPGDNDRRIEFVNGKFKPYNSGANEKEIKAGRGKAYETIQYAAKTATVDWSLIARRWAEVKSGTIGNDRFPKYTLGYVDKDGNVQPLNNGTVIAISPVRIGNLEEGIRIAIYRDGQKLNPDASGRFTLVPGDNKLGFAVYGKVGKDWEYVDFRYVTVRYESGTPTPTPTATPTPTTGRGPPWVLKKTEASVEKFPEGYRGLSGFQVSGGLTATGSAKQADFCNGKNTEIVYQSSHSFSAAPPGRLTPGQMVPVTGTASVKAAGGCIGVPGNLEYTGYVYTGISLQLAFQSASPYGTVEVRYNTATQPSPPPKSQAIDWKVPNGSRGQEMVVTYSAGTIGGNSSTMYTYAWE
ncbi:MAG: hypothetical protein Q7T26_00855 [Dehalococcoidia bacterium]|nr:hypothetical protein [Dehalococcoidia bacterium]